MRVPSHVIGIKGDECQCGRRASIRHCISCGSVRIYARMNRLHVLASGEQKWFDTQFRCQACGHLFVEQEREFCDAPPVSVALAQQKIRALHEAKQRGEHMRPQDVAISDAIEQMLGPMKQDPKKSYDLIIYHLRTEYADRKAAGEQLPMPMDVYVEARLKELQVKPPVELQTGESVLPPPSNEETSVRVLPPDLADPQRDAIPAEERSIRLEWGRKRLAGRSVPDVEEYVRRRLAGEIIND